MSDPVREALAELVACVEETGHWVMPGCDERWKAAWAAARAALAQPAEPVAYRHLHDDGWEYYDAPTGEDCQGCQALYAAPPAPQPAGRALTDEQLREIARNCGSSVANTLRSWWPECKEFARAIERAHGIGEGE